MDLPEVLPSVPLVLALQNMKNDSSTFQNRNSSKTDVHYQAHQLSPRIQRKFPKPKVTCSHWFNLFPWMREVIRTFLQEKKYSCFWVLSCLPFWSQITPLTGLAVLLGRCYQALVTAQFSYKLPGEKKKKSAAPGENKHQ